MNETSSASGRPLWLLLAPAIFLVLWSGGYSIAKLGILHAEPLTFLALRYAAVLIILAPFAIAMKPAWPTKPAQWFHIAFVGFLIQGVYFGLCYLAFNAGASAGTVAIIVCLQPILVGLIAPYFARERVSALRWLGLVLGLAGAATVILGQSAVKAESIFGILCSIGALIGITAGTLWEKRFGVSHHPIVSNMVQYVAGLASTLPLALATETLAVDWTSPEFYASFAYLVIANSLISMTLLLAMIRAGEVSRVSSLFYLVPPVATLMAWPILGEAMPPLAWLGMGIAAIGVAIASRRSA
ncbi:DMT family transporter [Nordella sp. HKS 07]|uniref:DMT family transporter n=1 Tax=Nordella sp. HKS 07 TaxID=2712222 RepID=UPI0013E1FC45|nr:DMT family transporter [Nordella sp. HKS 07]QIG46375.1 DMT family transporter [Nordella sp. HKS 07]